MQARQRSSDDSYVAACTLKLLIDAKQGSDAAMDTLIRSHRDIVVRKARKFYLRGADYEDTIQEGLIGLYKAIRDFRVDSRVSFSSFAAVCVERQLVTAVRKASRQKHLPLNNSISMSAPMGEAGEEVTIDNMLAGGCCGDPAEYVCSLEGCSRIYRSLSRDLSSFEANVLRMSADGMRYEEIAAAVSRDCKSVDNALQRARRKIAVALTLT